MQSIAEVLPLKPVRNVTRAQHNLCFCLECGAIMDETERIYENGAIYIWYDCSKAECDGIWLKKLNQQTV